MLSPPRHATPRHATPRHGTPRHATPRHATRVRTETSAEQLVPLQQPENVPAAVAPQLLEAHRARGSRGGVVLGWARCAATSRGKSTKMATWAVAAAGWSSSKSVGGQFEMLRPLVVLLRWRDRPLMRPTAGAALAGAFCPITCALGVAEPLSAAV